jgi:broad specificity phosphatase PhoE
VVASIFLIRHGETAWSLSGQHTSRTDLPLTEKGERQAAELRPALADLAFTHVFTSPLRRARRTAELAGWGDAARPEPLLQEWNYGDYEGQTSAEIQAERPGWNIFHDGCLGGESVAEVSDRADRLLVQLRLLDGRVALFSHSHFLRVLAMRWIGQPVRTGQHFTLDTGSISALGPESAHGDFPVIAQWNRAPR